MRTMLAYSLSGHIDQNRQGITRVEHHYALFAGASLKHNGVDRSGVGLHTWEASGERRRWPMWQHDEDVDVATVHPPVNYESLVGTLDPARAAGPLARELRARPRSVLQLGCPFVLAALNAAAELLLMTDAVGLGRLFQLRVRDGWIWSNRPAAAFLFAGITARPDPRGWRYHAGSEWFMDDSTPFEGLSMIGAATSIHVDGRTGRRLSSRVDTVSHWLSGCTDDPLDPGAVDAVVDSLQRTARSVARLWCEPPTIGLSGGRDSRAVTAAFLTAELDVKLHTNANPVGEAVTARELIRRWPHEVEHEVRPIPSTASPVSQKIGAVDRALGWMRYAEGLRPPSYLARNPPSSHERTSHLVVSGAAGELAHGHYYPRDLTALQALPFDEQLRACSRHLVNRLALRRGPNAAARAAVAARVDDVLRRAAANGANGAVPLDVFYLEERLRRWGTSAEQADTLIPLLTPEFVQAALWLTPEQRKTNALHLAVIARMIPQWAHVPFYGHSEDGTPPPSARPPRLWQIDNQRDLMAALVDDPSTWADDFIVPEVQTMWRGAITGEVTSGEEAILQRVIWRVVFSSYLGELNGEPVRHPAPIEVSGVGRRPVATPAPPQPGLRERLRRIPVVRRAARSRLGRRLRGLT